PSTNIDAAIRHLIKSDNRAVKVAAYPLVTQYDQGESLAPELDALRQGLLADLEKEKMKDEDRTALITAVMTIQALHPEILARLDTLLHRGASKEVQKEILKEMGTTTSSLVPEVLIRNFSKLSSE